MNFQAELIKNLSRGMPADKAYQQVKDCVREEETTGSCLKPFFKGRQNMARGRSPITAILIGTKVRMADCLEAENPSYQHDWVTASAPQMATIGSIVLTAAVI